jgi:hypothetical protein
MIAERKADISLNFCHLYYCENENVETGAIIAMQNATTLGYRDALNKKKGLSPPEIRLALSELAKYHACGYAYMKSFPGGIEQGLKEHKVSNSLFSVNQRYRLSNAIICSRKEYYQNIF